MKKLLWISDFISSGYGMISSTLVNELIKINLYEIYILSINSCADKKILMKKIVDIVNIPEDRIYINDCDTDLRLLSESDKLINESKDNYFIETVCGINKLHSIVNKIRPNIIFSINDNGILTNQINGLDNIHKKFNCRIFGYLAIDCYNFREDFFKGLENYDKIITMTHFARQEVLNTKINVPIRVLNHAVNNNIFKKNDKLECRSKILDKSLANKFIILNSNMNCKRKRLDICLKAFSIFVKDKDDVILILKCSLNKLDNLENRFDIENLMKEYSIEPDKMIIDQNLYKSDVLSILYNCADVGLSTTSGEGWGLTPCEMALCGIPQIIPNNTSYPEIFGNNYDYIKTIKINHRSGRKDCTDEEIKMDKYGYATAILSFPTRIIDNSHHTYVENINQYPNCYNILISEFGDTFINEKNIDMGNNLFIKLNIKDIQFLNKIDHFIGDKIIQVLIQLGENGEFLKSNIPKEKFFNNSSRATFQVAEKTLYATYDQYNVSVKIPDVDDTVRLLNKYYYNRDLIARDGEKCRDRILSKFRPEKICQDLINILEE